MSHLLVAPVAIRSCFGVHVRRFRFTYCRWTAHEHEFLSYGSVLVSMCAALGLRTAGEPHMDTSFSHMVLFAHKLISHFAQLGITGISRLKKNSILLMTISQRSVSSLTCVSATSVALSSSSPSRSLTHFTTLSRVSCFSETCLRFAWFRKLREKENMRRYWQKVSNMQCNSVLSLSLWYFFS